MQVNFLPVVVYSAGCYYVCGYCTDVRSVFEGCYLCLCLSQKM